ncbi:MAG: hypothetical protein GWP66_11915 [Gammaproteobacteria bacterium]|jgi:TPR repeat protein|nr:hypothetical protein [Gammaproteobacteria bacterium]
MGVKIPVHSDQFGYHQIQIWTLGDSGMFHRTPQFLMPHLLINFKDLSESLGEVVAPAYDRSRHQWSTATAYNYMGRPSSLYQHLRSEAKQRRIMVLTTPTNSGRAVRFSVNELRFKTNVSTAVKALTCRNFLDAIEVFIKLEEKRNESEEAGDIQVTHATDEATLAEFHEAVLRQWQPLAEQGDANAQYTLGYLHEQGEGIARSLSAALQWYLQAARQNHQPAQARLGSLYATGKGTPQNDVLAYFWFGLLARSGSAAAKGLCRKFAERMSPAQRAAAMQLANDWDARHTGHH